MQTLNLLGTECGPYKLVERLGDGATGVVYRAEHERIGRQAAIKVLHPDLVGDDALVQRFFVEARAANRIRHRCIIDIHDFVADSPLGPYLVMELVEGESLRQLLTRQKRLDRPTLQHVFQQLTSGLAVTHRRDIVHRDLKPENLMLVLDDANPGKKLLKILDFGLARLLDDQASQITGSRAVLGTPAYMAPEQCSSERDLDARVDVYAVGVMLFEAICGRLPFGGRGPGQILAQHLYTQPPRPSLIAPDISETMEAIILTALEKDRKHRFQSMSALRRALEAEWSRESAAKTHRGSVAIRSAFKALERQRRTSPPVEYTGDAPTDLGFPQVRLGENVLAEGLETADDITDSESTTRLPDEE